MNKTQSKFIAIDSGGMRLVFPLNSVKTVESWIEPDVLPGSTDWMMGYIPGETMVTPVLKKSFWGSEASEPDVMLILEHRGLPLGIPGANPEVIEGKPTRIADRESLHDCIEWSIMKKDDIAWCVNIPRLYRTLDLRYDGGDNIGGLDA